MSHTLYSREIEHCHWTGTFFIEAWTDVSDYPAVKLTFRAGLSSQSIWLSAKQAEQLIETLKKAGAQIPKPLVSSEASRRGDIGPTRGQNGSWRERLLQLAVRITYAVFPDILFKQELPSGLGKNSYAVRIERHYDNAVYLALTYEILEAICPKLLLPPHVIPRMIEALTEAQQLVEEHRLKDWVRPLSPASLSQPAGAG